MNLKKQILIISIIFGLGNLILLMFGIYPLFKNIKNDSNKLIGLKQDIYTLQAKAESLEGFKDIYGNLESDLNKINNFFVDAEAPIGLIEFWEETAQNSGLFIDVSSIILSTDKSDLWDAMGFKINLIGSFDNFLVFLRKIETGPYLMEIQSLTARNLTEKDLKSQTYNFFSAEDVNIILLVKVFSK